MQEWRDQSVDCDCRRKIAAQGFRANSDAPYSANRCSRTGAIRSGCGRAGNSPPYRRFGSISPLRDQGYKLQQTVMLGSDVPAHEPLPGVHRVAALVKRWIIGTHHGAVQPDQLDSYLDEFVFRFNRRNSRSRGLLFYRLLKHPARDLRRCRRIRQKTRENHVVELSGYPFNIYSIYRPPTSADNV